MRISKKLHKKVYKNIAGKIQSAMTSVTVICLVILGMVSLICEELSAQAMGLNGLVEEFSI